MKAMLTPRGIATVLIGSGLAGFVMATVFFEPAKIGASDGVSPADWALPEISQPGDGMRRIRSILSRQPWGGRLAEVANGGVRLAGGSTESGPQAESRAAERDVTQWRYLGSVRHDGAVNAVFLDEAGDIVHLERGSMVRGALLLSALEADQVTFESADGSRSIHLQLFEQTALEIEDRAETEIAPELPSGEDIND